MNDDVQTRMIRGSRCVAACLCALAAAVGPAGCGKKQKAPDAKEGATASAPAPTAPPSGALPANPGSAQAPAGSRGIPGAIDSVARDTAEKAAASLRLLADTSRDPAAFGAAIDPSQSALAQKFVGPAFIYWRAQKDLAEAARARFGTEGAQAALEASNVYQVDLGNGLRELLDAARFEEVRRDGPRAYVMSNDEAGQPQGAAVCFRENQGEWLLLLMLPSGETPWPEAQLSNIAALVGGPMTNAPRLASALREIAVRIERGEFKSVEAVTSAIHLATGG